MCYNLKLIEAPFQIPNFKDLLHKTLALPRQEYVGDVQNSFSSLVNFRHFTPYR